MKITFNGHSPTDREVEFTQDDQVRLFEIMKEEFINHIEFGTFDCHSYSLHDKGIKKLCQNHQVDVGYKKDRLAFFQAIMNNMVNPYG